MISSVGQDPRAFYDDLTMHPAFRQETHCRIRWGIKRTTRDGSRISFGIWHDTWSNCPTMMTVSSGSEALRDRRSPIQATPILHLMIG